MDRNAVDLAREVPQCDVRDADRRSVGMAESALEVVVDLLPPKRVLAEQIVGHHAQPVLGALGGTGRILPSDSRVRVESDDALLRVEHAPFLVHLVETVVVGSHVLNLVLEYDRFYLGDLRFGHGELLNNNLISNDDAYNRGPGGSRIGNGTSGFSSTSLRQAAWPACSAADITWSSSMVVSLESRISHWLSTITSVMSGC